MQTHYNKHAPLHTTTHSSADQSYAPNVSVIEVGDMAVSYDAGHQLKSIDLGSNVAVLLYDTSNNVAGLARIALPGSSPNTNHAKSHPAFFVNGAVPGLLGMLIEHSKRRCTTDIVAKIVGGAHILLSKGAFDVGKRNVIAIKTMLERLGIALCAEDVGGNINRTVSICVDTGKVHVSSPGHGSWEV